MNHGFWAELQKPIFALAPMADVTDAAFRYVIAKYSKEGEKNSFGPFSSLSTDIFLLKNSSARSVELRKARSEDFFQLQQFEQKFFEILKKGFAHKRKLLIKNLTEVSRFDLDTLKEIFDKCGISEKARAENLKVSDWLCLAKKFSPKIPKL